LFICLAFVFGTVLSSFFAVSQVLTLGFLILGILLISVLWKYKKFVIIGFCLLFLVAGIWRYQQVALNIPEIQERNISFVGTVDKEPDIRANNIKLTIKPVENGSRSIGMVLATINRYPEYQYGDKLKLTGKLQIPHIFKGGEEDKSSSSSLVIARDFNYKDYLSKDKVYSVMYWPKIELINSGHGNFIYAKILQFKDRVRESLEQNLSSPQGSILGAMILGDKRKLSEELKEKLNVAGVRHITAISGMHITIFSILLMQFLLGLGFWRRQAFYLTLAFLVLFIVMVGFPVSAVRAGIMGGIFLLARNLGRSSSVFRTIVFAAAGMLAFNPLLLKLDVGFQLSFLAVLGIIYLSPIFQYWLKKVPNIFQLRNILAMTLSAQVFTLPILIYNFGYVSLIAPITNILIIPFLPLIMVFGFISGVGGMIFQPLGWILSWPVWLLLTYLVKIVDLASQFSLASITLENIHWAWLVVFYLILGYIVWRLNKREKIW